MTIDTTKIAPEAGGIATVPGPGTPDTTPSVPNLATDPPRGISLDLDMLAAAILDWCRSAPRPLGEVDFVQSPHLTAKSWPFALGYLCAEYRAVQRERDALLRRVEREVTA